MTKAEQVAASLGVSVDAVRRIAKQANVVAEGGTRTVSPVWSVDVMDDRRRNGSAYRAAESAELVATALVRRGLAQYVD